MLKLGAAYLSSYYENGNCVTSFNIKMINKSYKNKNVEFVFIINM